MNMNQPPITAGKLTEDDFPPANAGMSQAQLEWLMLRAEQDAAYARAERDDQRAAFDSFTDLGYAVSLWLTGSLLILALGWLSFEWLTAAGWL